MKSSRLLVMAAMLGSVMAGSSLASAQNRTLPLEFSRRPVTNTAGLLRLDADLTINTLNLGILGSARTVGLSLGGGYGISSDFELGAVVLPMQLSPDFDYGQPQIYGRYRVARGDFELALDARVFIPTSGNFGLQIGAPLLLHLGDHARFDTGAFLDFVFPKDDTYYQLRIPLQFSFNLSSQFALFVRSGLLLPRFKNLTLPLGFGGLFTIPGSRGEPLVDLIAAFDFPAFASVGGDSSGVVTELWTATLSARIYLQF